MNTTASTWSFDSWLSAPFLKELSGKALYDMMVAIRTGSVTGEVECYVEQGQAYVLRFEDGQPAFDKAKVAEVLKRPSVVCAWMPGKAAGRGIAESLARDRGESTLDTVIGDIGSRAQDLLGTREVFSRPDHWLLLLHGTEVVFATDTSGAAGANLATGLVAQINAGFRDITHDKPLQRFSLDFEGTRFGFQTFAGSWSVVYRSRGDDQGELLDAVGALRDVIDSADLVEPESAMKSLAADRNETEYCLVRPRLYKEVGRQFRDWFESIGEPWDCFWFQYDDVIIYREPRNDEGQQEKNSAFAQLIDLIRQGFERLTNQRASNFVLYADGATVWCDFFEHGFWATRYADDKNGYRRTAEQAANTGWQLVEETFPPPV